MYNRAEVVDRNFKTFVKEGRLPQAHSFTSPQTAGLKASRFIDLFESQLISRHLDLRARVLKNKDLCYYTIGSSGHEGNAVFGEVFRLTDMAFLHYRSGANMVQRFKQKPGTTPVYDLLLSFMAAKEDPIAGGRHKVFGSYELLVPPQTSTIASHLPKAVGAALAVSRAKELNIEAVMPEDAVVLCSFGDASANHSTALGAFNTAAWIAYQKIKLPLVFICEDNGIGISVKTPNRWIERNFSTRLALEYIQCDGLNLCDVYEKASAAVTFAREHKKPVFLHMQCVRLLGHAGSDVEASYQSLSEIEANEFNDPLLHSARIILENGWMSAEEIVKMYQDTADRIEHVSNYVVTKPCLTDPEEVASTITACRNTRQAFEPVSESQRQMAFGREYEKINQPQHLAKLLNWALTDILLQYPNTLVFGEDVAQKGGVYNVTDGLYKRFGPLRVFNSPLDEQSIIGSAIGFAHNGFVPIPEVQFLAYVHNAEDQLRGEASTLAFFSQGQFTNPMVLRIAGLPYQKGFGGHFHNDNSLAVFRDIPGLIIAVPSTGVDAVKMLRTCVREAHTNGRVAVFVEPIALYMTKDLYKQNDKQWLFEYPKPGEEIPLGEFGVYGKGKELAIITYGNGTYYSLKARKKLHDEFKIDAKIIDLRWVAPLRYQALVKEIKDTGAILIVDECRKTGSLAEGLVMNIVERWENHPPIRVVAAHDCFIPLGKGAASGLPSVDSIFKAAVDLLRKKVL